MYLTLKTTLRYDKSNKVVITEHFVTARWLPRTLAFYLSLVPANLSDPQLTGLYKHHINKI